MKKIKKIMIWTALVLSLLLVITGCSQNQDKIFKAAMKMQDVNSIQEHSTMTFQLTSSGYETETQQQIDTAALFLNSAKLDLDVKTNNNEQKTVTKSQVNMNLNLPGNNLEMSIWLDSDLTQTTPKLKEIFKLPQIAKASLPQNFASKDYMVLDALNNNNPSLNNLDMTSMINATKKLQEMEINFLTSYSQRFNPNFEVVSKGIQDVQINSGVKSAQIYEINLNDAQIKDLIRYSVNNFAQDKEAMDFVKEFMNSIVELSPMPDKEKSLAEFNQLFDDFDAKKPELLKTFNNAMDQLNNVTFLGDKGIKLQYAISDGYLVKVSGNLDLDLAHIAQYMANLTQQDSAYAVEKGTLDLNINVSTDYFGINSSPEIQIPDVDNTNSFDYMDLMYIVANNAERLSGKNCYETAKAISERVNSGTVQDVIITSGNNFPDALSASVLARKLNAPILLVDRKIEDSKDALDYISQHLSKLGTVHMIGGTSIISSEFEAKLNQMGFINLDRIGGYDQYDTNVKIIQKLDVAKNTPVVIASGENFPDALSISSIASSKGYPILLVGKNFMAQGLKDFINKDEPTQMYIIGGTGVISESIMSEIQATVPNSSVTRLAGQDRFDTAGIILNTFYPSPKNIYITSGYNFPDALTGNVLASATGDPILLIDPSTTNLPPAIESYLKQLHDRNIRPTITSFGGSAVVPDDIVKNIEKVIGSGSYAE